MAGFLILGLLWSFFISESILIPYLLLSLSSFLLFSLTHSFHPCSSSLFHFLLFSSSYFFIISFVLSLPPFVLLPSFYHTFSILTSFPSCIPSWMHSSPRSLSLPPPTRHVLLSFFLPFLPLIYNLKSDVASFCTSSCLHFTLSFPSFIFHFYILSVLSFLPPISSCSHLISSFPSPFLTFPSHILPTLHLLPPTSLSPSLKPSKNFQSKSSLKYLNRHLGFNRATLFFSRHLSRSFLVHQ